MIAPNAKGRSSEPTASEQCASAATAMKELAAALTAIFPVEFQRRLQRDNLLRDIEETRVRLAAFTPHCRSLEIKDLRERAMIVRQMRALLRAAERMAL